ncbi:MAG: hypothetical protein AUJ79_11655 [Propionibacterium sp. CG1_02_60_36]|nr:MAG: hypothetical protein AUJ79_11655 [Propionibacterium sp. CG1_02_60_36]
MNDTMTTTTTTTTLADILGGWVPDGWRVSADEAIVGLVALPATTTLEDLRAWWTPEVALDLARRDGVGPGNSAVGWLCRALGDVLRGIDLSGVDLTDVDLSYVDLTGAVMRGVTMDGVDMTHAIMRGVDRQE